MTRMGVFDADPAALALWCLYEGHLDFRHKVMGGISSDPGVVAGWLRSKTGVSDTEEIRQMMVRTLEDLGMDIDRDATFEEAVAASEKMAVLKANTFKTDPERGLYLESRQLKAMLKENINALYAGERVGRTGKGAKNYAAERVFPYPSRLYLRRLEPDGMDTIVGHVTDRNGPRSTLTNYMWVEQAGFDFQVMVAVELAVETPRATRTTNGKTPAPPKPHNWDAWWPRIWTLASANGLGALRSQGHGQFELNRWDKLGTPTAEQFAAIMDADRERLTDRPLSVAAD
jgi:hypothetical protein